MSLAKALYNVVFRRTSTTAVAVIGGAFIFERMFDPTLDAIYQNINKGASSKRFRVLRRFFLTCASSHSSQCSRSFVQKQFADISVLKKD